MKRILAFAFAAFLTAFVSVPALAEESTAVPSTPKVIIEGCEAPAELSRGQTTVLKIKLKNTSYSSEVKNLTASFSASGGEILPEGTDTLYLPLMVKGGGYTWELPVRIKEDSPGGLVSAAVSCDYEAADGSPCSSSGSFTLKIPGIPQTTLPPELTEPKKDLSAPRLMVTGYSVEGGSIAPDEIRELTITLKNTSPSKYVKNIKLSLADESGELKTEGMGTAYIKSIAPLSTYKWVQKISASHSAVSGEHTLSVNAEYEDSDAAPYSASDSVRLDVKQKSRFEISGAELPVKAVQGETFTVSVSLMNTGKSRLSNCIVKAEVDGIITGGAVLVGTVEPGETGTATLNMRADSEITGEVSGVITVSCEDEFGEEYENTCKVNTLIEEKVEQTAVETEEEKKYPLWWLFALIGAVVGAGIGAAVPIIIYSAKQRKEDEEKL